MKKYIAILCVISSMAQAVSSSDQIVQDLEACARYIETAAQTFATHASTTPLTPETITSLMDLSKQVVQKHQNISDTIKNFRQNGSFTPEESLKVAQLLTDMSLARDQIQDSQNVLTETMLKRLSAE